MTFSRILIKRMFLELLLYSRDEANTFVSEGDESLDRSSSKDGRSSVFEYLKAEINRFSIR